MPARRVTESFLAHLCRHVISFNSTNVKAVDRNDDDHLLPDSTCQGPPHEDGSGGEHNDLVSEPAKMPSTPTKKPPSGQPQPSSAPATPRSRKGSGNHVPPQSPLSFEMARDAASHMSFVPGTPVAAMRKAAPNALPTPDSGERVVATPPQSAQTQAPEARRAEKRKSDALLTPSKGAPLAKGDINNNVIEVPSSSGEMDNSDCEIQRVLLSSKRKRKRENRKRKAEAQAQSQKAKKQRKDEEIQPNTLDATIAPPTATAVQDSENKKAASARSRTLSTPQKANQGGVKTPVKGPASSKASTRAAAPLPGPKATSPVIDLTDIPTNDSDTASNDDRVARPYADVKIKQESQPSTATNGLKKTSSPNGPASPGHVPATGSKPETPTFRSVIPWVDRELGQDDFRQATGGESQVVPRGESSSVSRSYSSSPCSFSDASSDDADYAPPTPLDSRNHCPRIRSLSSPLSSGPDDALTEHGMPHKVSVDDLLHIQPEYAQPPTASPKSYTLQPAYTGDIWLSMHKQGRSGTYTPHHRDHIVGLRGILKQPKLSLSEEDGVADANEGSVTSTTTAESQDATSSPESIDLFRRVKSEQQPLALRPVMTERTSAALRALSGNEPSILREGIAKQAVKPSIDRLRQNLRAGLTTFDDAHSEDDPCYDRRDFAAYMQQWHGSRSLTREAIRAMEVELRQRGIRTTRQYEDFCYNLMVWYSLAAESSIPRFSMLRKGLEEFEEEALEKHPGLLPSKAKVKQERPHEGIEALMLRGVDGAVSEDVDVPDMESRKVGMSRAFKKHKSTKVKNEQTRAELSTIPPRYSSLLRPPAAKAEKTKKKKKKNRIKDGQQWHNPKQAHVPSKGRGKGSKKTRRKGAALSGCAKQERTAERESRLSQGQKKKLLSLLAEP